MIFQIIHHFQRIPSKKQRLSDILQSIQIPSSFLHSLYQLLSRLSPQCGFECSVEEDEILVSFDPALYDCRVFFIE